MNAQHAGFFGKAEMPGGRGRSGRGGVFFRRTGMTPATLCVGFLVGILSVSRVHAADALAPTVAALPSAPRVAPVDTLPGKIIRVTVLPDGAWVTRQLEMNEATSTEQHVLVTDLPADIEQGSIQVQSTDMRLDAPMQWQTQPVEQSAEYRTLQKNILTLHTQRADADVRLVAAKTRLAIFQAQMGAPIWDKKRHSVPGAFLTDTKARDRFDRLLSQLLNKQRKAQDAVDATTQKLSDAEQALEGLRRKGGRLMLALSLRVIPGQKSMPTRRIQLRYRVKNAHWQPIYRADLDTTRTETNPATVVEADAMTTAPKTLSTLRWSFMAEVSQHTGEDWRDVPITLSLLDTRRYYPVPTLGRWTIGFAVPQKGFPTPRARMALSSPEMAQAAPLFTHTDNTGFNAQFLSATPLTLNSSAEAMIIPLMQQNLPAEANILITPSVSPLAILTARFTLDNPTPLPAGVWHLFLNGDQIGRLHEPALSPKKIMSLGFGVDRRMVVTLDKLPDQRDENGLIGKAQQLVRHRVITVHSQHQRPMPVTVLMNVPITEDADISVTPLADNTPPSSKQFDGVDGVWAWSNQIKPDQKITINFGFRLRWPADKPLHGL